MSHSKMASFGALTTVSDRGSSICGGTPTKR